MKILNSASRCVLWVVAFALLASGCDKTKFVAMVNRNVISELPYKIRMARMVDSEGHEMLIGTLTPNDHKYSSSPYTYEITKDWTMSWIEDWPEGEVTHSAKFEIGPEILQADPIELQITILKDRTVRATKYR